jgi:ATP-binding cassette subfamily B protein
MRRLLAFMKPYKVPAYIAVIALLIATVAELATPVILQRTIDNHIMARYYRIGVAPLSRDIIEEYRQLEAVHKIGDFYYLPETRAEKIPREKKDLLADAGLFKRESWYITPLTESPDLQDLLDRRPDFFSLEDDYILILSSHLDQLSRDEKNILRAGDIAGVGKNTLAYFLLLAVSLVFMFFQVYLMAYTGQEVMRDIRETLFGHTIRQSLGYLSNTPIGTLVTRITNDVETINEFFTSVATSVLRDFSLIAGVIVTLFLLDLRLALITLVTLPPVLIITLFFRTRARDAYRRVRLWVSRVNAFLSEHISGMEVVQIFGREKISSRAFSEKNEALLQANLSEMMVFALFRPLINLFTSISIGTILYFGGRMVLDTTVSLGIMIAYVNLIHKFYQPVMDFTEKFTIMQSAMAGGERIFNLLDAEDRIPDTAPDAGPDAPQGGGPLPSTVLPEIRGAIEFDHVYFSYKPGEPVLRDLTFSIAPGETVAIVGYTGAGKTTIANLIARMWDIQSGSIRVDGIDIRNLPLSRLRRAVQPVQQDVFMFAGTVADNISLGADIPLEKIRLAAETVQASRFIEKLPEGYDTPLTEYGSNLSTGQRQLLAFSRVVAHDPRILILDEATGSIDTETEQLIQQAIHTLMQDRTAIVIAHRLSTIRNADRILVLNEGRLVEEGSHTQLVKRDGLYAALYRLQYQKD